MNFQVGFDLVTDNSGFLASNAQAVKAQTTLNDWVKDFETVSREAFKTSTDEVEGFTKEIEDGTKSTGKMINEINKMGKTKSYVQQLKAEIKQYTSEAAKAGAGTKEWTDNLAKAAKLTNEIETLNKQVSALNGNMGENFARAAGESVALVARGYEGLTAVQTLAGVKNEEFEKTLLKLQSLNAIANISKDFGGLKDKLTEIKLGFQPLTDLYTKGNDALKNFTKEGKAGTDALATSNKGLFSSLSGGIKSFVSSGISGMKSLWATIAANPLGIVLVLIGGLVTSFVMLKDKIKPIGAMFDFIGKSISYLIAPLEKLAELTGLIADQNERRAKATIANTQKEIQAIQERYDFERQLADVGSRHVADIEKQKYEATKDRLNKTILALESQKKTNKKLNDEEIKAYEETQAELLSLDRKRTLDLAKEQNDRRKTFFDMRRIITDANIAGIISDEDREKAIVKRNTLDKLKSAHDALLSLNNQNTEAYMTLTQAEIAIKEDGERELAAVTKKYADKRNEEAKKQAEKLKGLQKDLANALTDLAKRATEADLENLSGEERIKKETELANAELAILRKTIEEKGKLVNKNFKFTAEQEAQFNTLQRQIYMDETQKLIQLQVERENAIYQAKANTAKQNESTLSTLEDADITMVGAMAKPDNLSEVEFEEAKERAILEIQKQYAARKLQLAEATILAEREATIKGLNNELAIIGNNENEETRLKREEVLNRVQLSEEQFAAQLKQARAGSAALEADIDQKLAKLNAKKPFNLAKLLGMTDEQFSQLKEQTSALISELTNLVAAVYDAKNQILDEELKKTQEVIADREKNIQDLESKLDEQQRLADEGKGNHLNTIRDEIAQEEAARKDALENEKRIKKEKQELARQQLIIDTAVQASNLVVAATQIYATVAKDPYSTAIATATVIAMIAAFGIQKAAAFKSVNNSNNYKDGVFDLDGPGTETSDSIKANLSKGETVFSAKKTRDNYNLFKGIFNDDERLIHDGVLDLIKGKGIRLIPDIQESLFQRKSEIRKAETHNYIVADNKKMEGQLADMNGQFAELLKQQKHKTYVDSKGNTIKQMGSHTQIIRHV